MQVLTAECTDSDELNYILQTINCAALVEVALDTTMVMLTEKRLPELTTYSRCAAIYPTP